MPNIKLSADGMLLCSHCGDDSLHKLYICLFPREEDQQGDTYHVDMRTGEILKNFPGVVNPSKRRDGASIIYWCEICKKLTKVDFAQHKGHEHISVDDDFKGELIKIE